jgi:hypothetical protein
MLTLPRDTVDVPIQSGSARNVFGATYEGKITWFSAVRNRPDLFPGTDNTRGYTGLKAILGNLHGLDMTSRPGCTTRRVRRRSSTPGRDMVRPTSTGTPARSESSCRSCVRPTSPRSCPRSTPWPTNVHVDFIVITATTTPALTPPPLPYVSAA